MRALFIFIAIFNTIACSNDKMIDTPDDNNEPDEVLEIKWVTRMDSTKEIVNLNDGIVYKDWYIYTGDLSYPPTIYAFNITTGKKVWEHSHSNDIFTDNIDYSTIVENIYIAFNNEGVFGFNLESQEVIWQHDFNSNTGVVADPVVYKNSIYASVFGPEDSDKVGPTYIYKFDYLTGDYKVVHTFKPYGKWASYPSPPVLSENPETGHTIMIVNNTWNDVSQGPENYPQDLIAVDLITGETLWETNDFSEMPTNVGVPPVIYDNKVIVGGDWSIYAFDMRTGEKLWRTQWAQYPWGIWDNTKHLIHNDKLYVNNGLDDVSCLNPENGTILWNNPKGGANCTNTMNYYEDMLVFTSWGYGSVMVLDAITGKIIHKEQQYDNSSYNNDVVYDPRTDMFITSTYKHTVGFKIN